MNKIEDIAALRRQLQVWRQQGERIGFVPTMGFLHRGHLSLIEAAKKHAQRVVVSIFVNPTQFEPHEDLDRYPRDVDGDLLKVQEAGGDVVFLPSVEDLYPSGAQTFVEVSNVTKALCGIERPNHFRGVATIVTKLFMIVQPDVAVFGEKDFQQLATIRQMVRDLHMQIEVLGGPIVREEDGLAMSSRNVYLDAEQRTAAVALSKALREARRHFARGEVQPQVLCQIVSDLLAREPLLQAEYVELRDAHVLEPVQRDALASDRFFLAARLGKTRLIDNAPLAGSDPLDRLPPLS